ncbi:MAG: response regulator [Spirochaetaceae bacterium]|nr:response regulator [Spirochaetaceae bacterium]
MKLLVVDDSSITRKIIKAVADVLQMEMEEAQDGIEALEILSKKYEEIDLVLLDWNMPQMSGYEVLVEIKSNDKYKKLPVMMVTTEGQRSNIVAAVRAGAANYLTKPFTVEELETKIIECIGKEGEF